MDSMQLNKPAGLPHIRCPAPLQNFSPQHQLSATAIVPGMHNDEIEPHRAESSFNVA